MSFETITSLSQAFLICSLPTWNSTLQVKYLGMLIGRLFFAITEQNKVIYKLKNRRKNIKEIAVQASQTFDSKFYHEMANTLRSSYVLLFWTNVVSSVKGIIWWEKLTIQSFRHYMTPDDHFVQHFFFQPTDPRSRCHRLVALILMCLLGFGSYFCMDNPAALQVCGYCFQSKYKYSKIKVIIILNIK